MARYSAEQQAAISTYFDNDAAIFDSFEQAVMAELGNDLRRAETASQAQDFAELRTVVHTLKSVLLTLGLPGLSAQAAAIEAEAVAQRAVAWALWTALRDALVALRR